MSPKKTKSKKSGARKNIKGGADTDVDTKVSSINNFTSSRTTSPVNVSQGSTPKSSEGFKTSAPAPAPATASFFSGTNKSRLLSVPATAASAVVTAVTPSRGSSVFKYILIIFILVFLFLTLYLYLEKPKGTSLSHLYDPVSKFFDNLDRKTTTTNDSGIKKLEKTLEEKKVVNNIDKKSATDENKTGASGAPDAVDAKKKEKKKPVIPAADDSTSLTQRKPKSKAGFCYIGEDRGFRSCIEVGEGDVCMSGDIFPTQAICINPNLRE
jgi:hypothetical protein